RQTLHGHLAPVMGVGFGADGDTPVSAALDGTVRLWAGTAELAVYPDAGSGLPLTALAFNPDHSRSASTSTGGQILLQDVSRATLAQLRPPANTTRTAQPMAPAPAAVPATTAALPAEGRNLIIPAAGIRTALTSFPLGAETWIIDPWERLAGHFAGTAWLTDTGNIVIGGHSEYPDGRGGVFRRLYNVGMGDEIFVTDGALQRRYLVVNVLTVNYTDLSVIYPTGFNRLTLITCDIPSYQPQQNMYAERLVVVADEVQP
nr:sortase [Anaerolineae bacterium]